MSDEQRAFMPAAAITLVLALLWALLYPILRPDAVTLGATFSYALLVWSIDFAVGAIIASAIGVVHDMSRPPF